MQHSPKVLVYSKTDYKINLASRPYHRSLINPGFKTDIYLDPALADDGDRNQLEAFKKQRLESLQKVLQCILVTLNTDTVPH